MDDSGGAAWFPVTHDQSYSRCPAQVESITGAEVCAEALAEAQFSDGADGAVSQNRAGLSIRGNMYSSQQGGWQSPKTAAYLYDQMT